MSALFHEVALDNTTGKAPLVRDDETPGALTFERLSHLDELKSIEPEWQALLEKMPAHSVFCTPDWLIPWWESFGADTGELCTVVVRRDGELYGICPLALQRSRLHGVAIRKLVSLTNYHTPKFDFVLLAEPQATLRSVLEFLSAEVRWHALALSYVPLASSTLGALRSLGEQGLIRYTQYEKMCSPYLEVDGDFDDYYQRLSKKFRTNNARALRSLGKLGEVEFEAVASGPQLERVLDEAFEIEAAGWQGNQGSAILQRSAEARFYRQVAFTAAGKDQLRLYFIKCQGKRIAFDCCLVYDGVVSGLKNAYHQDFAKYSPGTLLRKWLLEQLSQEHNRFTYDMLGTAAPWKLRWTDKTSHLQELVVFPRTLRGWMLFELYAGVSDRLKRIPWIVALVAAVRKRK